MAVSGPAVDRAWGAGASDRSKCGLMPTGAPPSARGPWFGHLSSWRPVALGLGCRARGLINIASVSRSHEEVLMKTRALVLAIALLSAASGASAYDYKAGNLEIDRPWSRATPKGAKTAAGYLKITNSGSAPDRLVRSEEHTSEL